MTRRFLSPSIQRFIFTGIGVLLAVLALLMPYWEVAEPDTYIGGLLVWAAILEIAHGFRRAENQARLSAWVSGAVTLMIGMLLINASLLKQEALVNFIYVLLLLDASRYLYFFIRSWRGGNLTWRVFLPALGNGLIVLLMFLFRGKGIEWVIALCGSLRILGTIYNLFTARMGTTIHVAEDIVESMGMKGNEEVELLAAKIGAEDNQRSAIDASWIITFVLILFFIHLGRMGFDQSASGILSPVVAVMGDMFIALIFAFGMVAPLRALFRRTVGLFERSLWKWIQKIPEAERRFFSLRTLAIAWLKRQMRLSISIRKSGYNFVNAFRNGLKIGLPFSALLAAIIPVLGMSWYFDTENWASGVWDSYAASRTDVWREAMIAATGEKINAEAFRLHPPGITDSTDFSFVVIGDPGEGDPSQYVLKDQILTVSNKKDVKFVVISSDVIYPSGAMRDYERKFFLPFKGVTKPIYAIPGNHDWYDALDGFVATFFTPAMAKLAIEARVRSDLKFTGTTEGTIESIIRQASLLRKEYQVPTGYQTAPFFQVSNDYFVLLTVDTGVLRRVDASQLAWIKSVLDASKGKFVMALLGHPFYAIGEYQGNMTPEFEALHELLRAYKVPLVMAGDTHDLEYYKEPPQQGDGHTMHHFVNGGGGAYLSIGAAMAPANSRPTKDWAIYPSREPLMHKIDSLTPDWKYPGWIWLKKYNGYPFSAEWLSAAFDYNQAPYFQSFMEIKVERSRNRIRLIPYGVHGQLRWNDLEYGGMARPASAKDSDLVEWTLRLQ
ncbi:MAG: metallophosphoesterase [Cyclobacteriaceae bacterium]|nr:metallophosphoesterase [Cyclobacteriaceae bacterium]MDH4296132.1 metallophosphoesterase [Cyclobacteriaceae bacterium]MDH5248333.1 metallophosphoesterase [Cyclobacteriaceae bacterium]